MLLHEAMVKVLDLAGRPLSPSAVAAEVNQWGHYSRRDGAPVPSSQISARANKYPHLFLRSPGLIGLRGHSLEQRTSPGELPPPRRVMAGPTAAVLKSTMQDPLAPLGSRAFLEIGALGDLSRNGLPSDACLESCGVYVLVLPPEYIPRFHEPAVARSARNVIAPWDLEQLRKKWVLGTRIAYIGLAGRNSQRSLRKRLRDLLKHRAGKTTDSGPHRGGEIIWQLVESDLITIRVLPTAGPPVPRTTEEELLSEFFRLHAALPFANRQG